MATDTPDPETWQLPEAVVEDLLTVPRCRYALEALAERGPLTVHDLAREIAGRERDEDPDRVSHGVAMRVYDDLYDRHLPRLTATAVVEFDPQHATLTLVDDTVREHLG